MITEMDLAYYIDKKELPYCMDSDYRPDIKWYEDDGYAFLPLFEGKMFDVFYLVPKQKYKEVGGLRAEFYDKISCFDKNGVEVDGVVKTDNNDSSVTELLDNVRLYDDIDFSNLTTITKAKILYCLDACVDYEGASRFKIYIANAWVYHEMKKIREEWYSLSSPFLEDE